MRTSRVIYVCLLGIAVVIFAYDWWSSTTTDLTPVDVPYPLEPTAMSPMEFTADLDASYSLYIRVTRPTDLVQRKAVECLMGYDRDAIDKYRPIGPDSQLAPVINFSWHLEPLDGGMPESGLVSGAGEGFYSSANGIIRPVGYLVAQRGNRYRLRVRTMTSAEPLAFADPRVVMTVSSYSLKEQMVTSLYYGIVGLLTGLIGLIMLGVDLWKRWHRAV